MSTTTVFVSESEVRRLKDLLELGELFPWCDRDNLRNLDRALDSAQVVSPQQLPADRVAMNSGIYVTDVETGQQMYFMLVFPSDADISEHKISVLAPIGTALLGSRAGTVIQVDTPGGTKKFHIDEVVHYTGVATAA